MKNKPDFSWSKFYNFILIYDLNKGNMSVTNGMEYVLSEIRKKIDNVGMFSIIYRDSMQIYAQVLIDKQGEFIGYESPCKTELFKKLSIEFLNHKAGECENGR
jgi:hypothetical protein